MECKIENLKIFSIYFVVNSRVHLNYDIGQYLIGNECVIVDTTSGIHHTSHSSAGRSVVNKYISSDARFNVPDVMAGCENLITY